MFSCEFCKIFENTFYNRTPLVAAPSSTLLNMFERVKNTPVKDFYKKYGVLITKNHKGQPLKAQLKFYSWVPFEAEKQLKLQRERSGRKKSTVKLKLTRNVAPLSNRDYRNHTCLHLYFIIVKHWCSARLPFKRVVNMVIYVFLHFFFLEENALAIFASMVFTLRKFESNFCITVVSLSI